VQVAVLSVLQAVAVVVLAQSVVLVNLVLFPKMAVQVALAQQVQLLVHLLPMQVVAVVAVTLVAQVEQAVVEQVLQKQQTQQQLVVQILAVAVVVVGVVEACLKQAAQALSSLLILPNILTSQSLAVLPIPATQQVAQVSRSIHSQQERGR
jgi:hypothetical protein